MWAISFVIWVVLLKTHALHKNIPKEKKITLTFAEARLYALTLV